MQKKRSIFAKYKEEKERHMNERVVGEDSHIQPSFISTFNHHTKEQQDEDFFQHRISYPMGRRPEGATMEGGHARQEA